MSWFKIIMFVIQYGPKIVGILKDIWDEVERIQPERKVHAKRDFRLALNDAKMTKSMRPIDEFRDRIR